jgi:hypothetical protein
MLSACQPVGDGPQSGSQEEKGGRGVQTTEPTAESGRVGDAIWIFEGRCCAFQGPVLQEIPSQGLATGDQAVMGIRQGEHGKAGEGQMAGPTHASANLDPIVSLVMSLLAPPAVRSNGIAQTSRTTARDRFLAGGSPVQIWVARITAKWDKNNRTAWEALSLNRLLSGSVFRRGLPLPHKIRMKAIIPSSSRFCSGSDQDRPVNHEKAGECQVYFSFL